MHVIAALDEERQLIAELARQPVRPRPQRHHRLARLDEAGRRHHAPAGAGVLQPARVALHDLAAARQEQREIGGAERCGVGRRQRIGEMHAPDRRLAEARLQREQGGAVEHGEMDAEGARLLRLRHAARPAARAAEHLDPAALAQQRLGARLRRDPAMLRHRLRHQRAQALAAALARGGRGGLPIAPERGRQPRQRHVADMGARIAI